MELISIKNPEKVEGVVGYIPQDDLLMEGPDGF
jgi:hypothetical protein